jgi:hypothetical protein
MLTQYYTKQELREVVEQTFQWCVNKFGSPLKSGEVPKLRVRFTGSKNLCGFYRKRELFVFPNNVTSLYELIATVVHEYTHFLQMPKLNDMSKYYRLYKVDGYYNEFEIEAFNAEKKYTKKVMKHLKLI